jgi:PHD/YefM family antitoxin component YafN of YafNO toxin-antitoxin module
MPRLAPQKTHRTVSNSLSRVVTKRERVVVHRRGKAVTALIPLEDLALLEELEDQKDVEEYRAAKAEWEREGRKTVPWAKIKADLSL